MKIFATYDTKVEKYIRPFFFETTNQAIRSIETICSDPTSDFNKYPFDYVFFELGEWDEVSAKFTLLNAPHSLGLAKDFIKTAPSLGAEKPAKPA